MNDNRLLFTLYIAAENGNIAIAEALLEANADIHAIIERSDSGTALSVATFKGDKAMVKFLVDEGADVSKKPADGRHLLTVACLNGHTDVVSVLLDAGADVSAVGAEGITALAAAAQIGSCDIVKMLLDRGAQVNHVGGIANGTPLHYAVYAGNSECAYVLLRSGANVLARDNDGSALLHIAAYKGFTDVIEVLLSAGAQVDINLEDTKYRTPLASASGWADAKAVSLLLDAGADINRESLDGRTAIFDASDLEIVKTLLERGANVNIIDKHEATVLHAAGFRGACAGVMCALYRAGADPTVKTSSGQTAAEIAREKGHEDAAKLLDLLAAKHRSLNST